MENKRIKHLVVDSGAFIKHFPVHEYAEHIYTVDGAVKEIKDKATRQRLQFLPYKLLIVEPEPNVYKHVMEFAKKTGDYSNLSAVDLKIIALTYQLEKENVGTDHLNDKPSCKVTSKPANIDSNLSGFYYPKELVLSDKSNKTEKETFDDSSDCKKVDTHSSCQNWEKNLLNEAENLLEGTQDNVSSSDDFDNDSNGEEEYSTDEDPDADSWITPSNISEIQKKMDAIKLEQTSVVACATTDFSIQNVLIQMGLNVISVDGMLIKQAKVFILRCYACYRTTNDNTKKFCPNCGNKTLKRVAVTVNDDGTKNVHINFRRPINIRGKRFSLPTPKGGKHTFNPIVCEDQPVPQNRMSKKFYQKTNAMQDDYEVQKSPFAINDVYSRAVHLGIHVRRHFDKRNPNASSKKTGNKKKK